MWKNIKAVLKEMKGMNERRRRCGALAQKGGWCTPPEPCLTDAAGVVVVVLRPIWGASLGGGPGPKCK